jgi:hypothetical protein
MNGVGNDRRELARGVYEQHNESIRHLENQRLWFTLVYLFLYGGALAFIPEGLYPDADWLGIGFVAVVSLFGLLFVIDIQRSLKAHRDAADLILKRYDLAHYLPAYRQGMRPRLFGASRLVPSFFLFCFCLSLYLLLYAVYLARWAGIVIALVIFLVGVFLIYSARFDELPASDDESE